MRLEGGLELQYGSVLGLPIRPYNARSGLSRFARGLKALVYRLGGRKALPYGITRACKALVYVILALWPAVAGAWTSETQVLIAESAASIAPPDLRRQIEKHMDQFKRGSTAPYGDAQGAHYKHRDGGGDLDALIERETVRAIDAIRSHRPFRDIVYQLGIVSHFLADANNPLNTAQTDPREPAYFADYLGYVAGAQERFAVVFYGEGRDLDTPESLSNLVDQALNRGRRLYPSLGREYRRVGGPPGESKFDDKSVAFAVGSLAVSHAVSDVAAVLRYVWIEAGGGDERPLETTKPVPSGS